MASEPQYVDIDILKSIIDCNDSAVHENYYVCRSDDDEDKEGDETKIGMTDIIINNINQQENLHF